MVFEHSNHAGGGQQGWLAKVEAFTLGRPSKGPMPTRVATAMAHNEQTSEVLVCLTQFSAIIFFAIFYLVTPKGFPEHVPFEPIPLALAAYSVFTGVRLGLAIRGRLTRPLLMVSVVADVFMLMVTIWSFHLQYNEPAAVYLKAPTLMYVFIMIALRVLRFDAVYIVLTGVVSVIGWLVLVVYAVYDAPDMEVTRNFAVYAKSNAILIGAEVDKLVSIAVVTTVLTVAVMRGRRLLVTAVRESHASGELSRFFAHEVSDRIRTTDQRLAPGEGAIRQAAVLMIDLRAFTHLAACMTPSAVIRLLGDYHSRLVPVIQDHGGCIDKFLGDGILATFGAAQASDNYAAEALKALEAVIEEAHHWSQELQRQGRPGVEVGAAVATGAVLFGVVGHESRLEFTAIGDVVNLAAKLEKYTKIAGTPGLATRDAVTTARRQGYRPTLRLQELAGVAVDGVATTIDLVSFEL